MFGVDQFCAIVNPPQSSILAVGTTSKKVMPNEAKDALPNTFVTVNVCTVTLSCDHVCDPIKIFLKATMTFVDSILGVGTTSKK